MPIIVKSPKAKSDLVEIWSYIADDSEIRADAFVQTIDKKFHNLINEPFLGIARDEIETDLRSFPVGRHVIFYRFITEGIEIIRVLHGARDLNIIFNADNWNVDYMKKQVASMNAVESRKSAPKNLDSMLLHRE